MAGITRKTAKIFASGAGGTGVAVPGSVAAGSVAYSTDVATLQSTAFENGLADMIIAGTKRLPVYEEINAVEFVLSTQIAYLLERGIPEYDSGTTYNITDVVRKTGTYELYGSVGNTNAGNALPAAVTDANWTYLGTLENLAGAFLPTAGGTMTGAINEAAYATVASATTTDIGAATSNNVSITGTTTITGLGTIMAGATRRCVFAGALTLTHNATSLILPGGANITTAAGDTMTATSLGSGNWRVTSYTPASGNSVIPSQLSAGFVALSAAYASTTTLTMAATSAIVYDSSNNTKVVRTVSGTINCATTGANGLDAGSLANNTWYYGYIIYNASTATTALLASTSATAPTLPSGYTYATKACTAFLTNGSAQIIGFKQIGADWQYVVGSNLSASRLLASGASGSPTTPTWTSTSVSSFVPTAIASKIKLYLNDVTGSNSAGAAPNNSYGVYNSATNAPPMITSPASVSSTLGEFVLESTNIYYYSGAADGYLYCMGFTINL